MILNWQKFNCLKSSLPVNENHYTGPDGEFLPTTPKKDGEVTIGYCEELLEWLYYCPDIDYDDKLERILKIEELIDKLINRLGRINYKRTWSIKLQKSNK
jgi:hypothetical protein